MSKDRLVVDGEPGAYVIAWYLAEDQEIGGRIGEGPCVTEESLAGLDVDGLEALGAELEGRRAAEKTNGRQVRPSYPFTWETLGNARAALRLIKAGVAARKAGRPWPEWAQQALAAGWKPPKGWTP